MIALAYSIGLALYFASVAVSYSKDFKASHYYFPVGLLLALTVNFLWLYIAKHSPNKESIYVRGLIWDSMIVGSYALLPIAFYGVRLSGFMLVGAVLIVSGLVLVKLG